MTTYHFGPFGERCSQQFLCWTRMQTEAGQPLERILARKDNERRVGGGHFFWGVGNAPSRLVPMLARLGRTIPAFFSVMKSKPKAYDADPAGLLVWRRYVDAHGAIRDMPEWSIVTSRRETAGGVKGRHYALVCRSTEPLLATAGGVFEPGRYRNAGPMGGPIGASQVTALVEPVSEPMPSAQYSVDVAATLVSALWVKLVDPIEIPSTLRTELDAISGQASSREWLALARAVRQGNGINNEACEQFELEKPSALRGALFN